MLDIKLEVQRRILDSAAMPGNGGEALWEVNDRCAPIGLTARC